MDESTTKEKLRDYVFSLLKGRATQVSENEVLDDLKTYEGRRELVKNLELFRGEICISQESFEKLAALCMLVLESALKGKEWDVAKVIMHMASNFYFMDEKGDLVFLQSHLKFLPIWSNIDFWNEAYYDSLIRVQESGEDLDLKQNLPKWKDLDERAKHSKIEYLKNSAYGLLGTYTHNMLSFGVSIEDVHSFLKKQCEINDLSNEQRDSLVDVIGKTRESILSDSRESAKKENLECMRIRKQLWKMKKHQDWKRGRKNRLQTVTAPERVHVDSDIANALYGSREVRSKTVFVEVKRGDGETEEEFEEKPEKEPVEEETKKYISSFKTQWLETKRKNWERDQKRRERNLKQEGALNLMLSERDTKSPTQNGQGTEPVVIRKHKSIITGLESILEGENVGNDAYATYRSCSHSMLGKLEPFFGEPFGGSGSEISATSVISIKE